MATRPELLPCIKARGARRKYPGRKMLPPGVSHYFVKPERTGMLLLHASRGACCIEERKLSRYLSPHFSSDNGHFFGSSSLRPGRTKKSLEQSIPIKARVYQLRLWTNLGTETTCQGFAFTAREFVEWCSGICRSTWIQNRPSISVLRWGRETPT